jgi:ribosomal protein S7
LALSAEPDAATDVATSTDSQRPLQVLAEVIENLDPQWTGRRAPG